MKQEITIKDPFTTQDLRDVKKVRVKFNFPLASPTFDSSIALKKAKEEKSGIAFDLQTSIDMNTAANFYEAGKVYEVPEDFYKKFSEKRVRTTNPLFGKFEGNMKKFAVRPVVPFMLKVDADGVLLNPMDQELDLYAKD